MLSGLLANYIHMLSGLLANNACYQYYLLYACFKDYLQMLMVSMQTYCACYDSSMLWRIHICIVTVWQVVICILRHEKIPSLSLTSRFGYLSYAIVQSTHQHTVTVCLCVVPTISYSFWAFYIFPPLLFNKYTLHSLYKIKCSASADPEY